MRPQRKRQTIVARECLARDADLGFIVEEIPPKGIKFGFMSGKKK